MYYIWANVIDFFFKWFIPGIGIKKNGSSLNGQSKMKAKNKLIGAK